MYKINCVLTLLLATQLLFGQNSQKEIGLKTITQNSVEAQLNFIASDWTEGREIGTKGNFIAADYIKSMFQFNGLVPLGDKRHFKPNNHEKLQNVSGRNYTDYFQDFEVLQLNESNRHQLEVVFPNGTVFGYKYHTDFSVSLQSKDLTAQGFVVNDISDSTFKKGKWLLLDKTPSNIYKLQKEAKDAGMLGVLIKASDDVQSNWADNRSYYYQDDLYEGTQKPESFYDKRVILAQENKVSIPIVKVSERLFNNISSNANGVKVRLRLKADTKLLKAHNILGMIEGENKNEVIVVGAHYDHLGMHNGRIWNGADDNASGVVAVLSIARACMATGVKPKRTIVFACWDGEERGLLGSRYYASQVKDTASYVAYLNFDMVGRDNKPNESRQHVLMFYTAAYKQLQQMNKQHTRKYQLKVETEYRPWENPVGGSDNASFARMGIPIFWYHTDGHPDYHKATDHSSLINWEKLTNIIRLSYLNVWQLANQPQRLSK